VHAFFPLLLPGELLYSGLARFGLLRGIASPKALMNELYGRANMVATVDLPNNIGDLVAGLQPSMSKTADLVNNHTLFRYYTAFQSPGQREAGWTAMLGGEGSVHFLLGASVFRTGRPDHLQFCPNCLDEQEKNYGFPYWRIIDQLPGVVVCAKHERRLRRSGVRLAAINRHAYVPLTRDLCRAEASPIIDRLRGQSLELAIEIVDRSANLIEQWRAAVTTEELRDGYRSRLLAIGLLKGRQKVRQKELHSLLTGDFGNLLEKIPGAMPSAGSETWLNSIVRTSNGAHAPLHHVILEIFLDRMDALPAAERLRRIETAGSAQCQWFGESSNSLEPDWDAIDREYSIKIRRTAYQMKKTVPPLRVTAAAVGRALKGRDWLAKRTNKLPASARAMEFVVEGLEEFRLRRLRWHVKDCLNASEYDPWVMLRRAGLRSDFISVVRHECDIMTGPMPNLAKLAEAA